MYDNRPNKLIMEKNNPKMINYRFSEFKIQINYAKLQQICADVGAFFLFGYCFHLNYFRRRSSHNYRSHCSRAGINPRFNLILFAFYLFSLCRIELFMVVVDNERIARLPFSESIKLIIIW